MFKQWFIDSLYLSPLPISFWKHAIEFEEHEIVEIDGTRQLGCGFKNGQELLAYYTMAQTSFLLFIVVILVIAAW